jgi:phosphate transport system permease protein
MSAPAVERDPWAGAAERRTARRRLANRLGRALFAGCVGVALLALLLILGTIVDEAFGYVAVEDERDRDALVAGRSLESLAAAELAGLLRQELSAGGLSRLEAERPLDERSAGELRALVLARIVEPEVVAAWPLHESLLRRDAIAATVAAEHPAARLEFRSWLNPQFLSSPMASEPLEAGVRTAILGTLWVVSIAVLVALPLGVGAAVYLEEFARPTRATRLLRACITNLAGVPSIVYGMLGLVVFVRWGEAITEGRTILAASLALALLLMPIVVINAQEAIRAVPRSLREASLALGATRLATVWHLVLPAARPGILTGTILAMSQAIGETAVLIAVGATAFVTADPNGPFAAFTVLPIQIFNWTLRPQDEFRHLAAAAILVLLALLLSLNAVAIALRARLRQEQ